MIAEANQEECRYWKGKIMSRLDKKNGEKEYFKPIRVALKSIFNFGNVISALNIWVVVTVKYGAGIIN